MTARNKKPSRRGFTLIELLVVIAIIALLAALLVPAVVGAMFKARLAGVVGNGRQIYTAMFNLETSDPLSLASNKPGWPMSTPPAPMVAYQDSSHFFHDLVESNYLDVAYNFFNCAGSGLQSAPDGATFILPGALHNIWCITLDVNDSLKSGTPVLFTQNFKFQSAGAGATIGTMASPGLDAKAPPYGQKGGAVVMRGGAGYPLDIVTAVGTNFNATAANNKLLWPLSSGQFLNP